MRMEPQGTPRVQRAEEEEGELGEAWGQVELIRRTKEGHCHQSREQNFNPFPSAIL